MSDEQYGRHMFSVSAILQKVPPVQDVHSKKNDELHGRQMTTDNGLRFGGNSWNTGIRKKNV